MRILSVGSLYPPHHFGGYELVWQTAVRALREAGHDVRVLCVSDRREGVTAVEDDPGVHRELRWYARRQHEFPRLPIRARIRLERHNHAVLQRHLQEFRPQAVSWWAMGGMSLSLVEAVRRARIPAIGWVNNDWMDYGRSVDLWTAPLARRPAVARAAEALTGVPARVDLDAGARWIFCSEAIRRASPRLHDTHVLYQGPAPVFAPHPEREWSGRLLYAGRLDERKGVGTLIDAVTLIPEASLLVVGDGESPAAVAALRERARGGRISFRAIVPRARLADDYVEADAVVFPVEWEEPWGLVPLEAMAVGRPVIATGRGGSAEYLEHERNALLFPAGDAAALSAAVRRLAGDPELRRRLREGGFATARRFSEAAWSTALVAEHERLGAGRR